MSDTPVTRSDEQWRTQLDPLSYAVLRQSATEPPFTGEYTDTDADGSYHCRGCGALLFDSQTKFDSHCGWPSFYQSTEGAVYLVPDHSLGRERTEVRCATCQSHLGHVFAGEGYQTPTDQRYCINSAALHLEAEN